MSTTVDVKDLVKYTWDRQWSALYVKGLLDLQGDDQEVNQRIFEIIGLDERDDDSFLCGKEYPGNAAKTLEIIDDFRVRDQQAWVEAEALRVEAEKLLSRADEIMKTVRSNVG